MRKFIADPEEYVLIALSIISALVSMADFFGLLEGVPWLSRRVPTLILLLVSMASAYLVLERRNKLDSIERIVQKGDQETLDAVVSGVERIINSLQGVDVRLFEEESEVTASLEQRIKSAKRSIDVTHFSPFMPKSTIAENSSYYETLSKIVKGGRRIRVRRLVLVRNKEHLEWIRETLIEFAGLPFYVGCYTSASQPTPPFGIAIIDGSEVYLTGGERVPSYDTKTIWTKHPVFAKVIQEHFDALWRNSLKIRDGMTIDEFLGLLEKSLQSSQK